MLLCATLSASHARHLAPHTRSGQTRRLLVCMKLSGSILRPDGPRRPVVCTLSRANGPPGPCGTRPRCLGSIFMRLDQPCLALSCSGGGWERGKGGRCVRSEATGRGGGRRSGITPGSPMLPRRQGLPVEIVTDCKTVNTDTR
jgi:hypothetical protein